MRRPALLAALLLPLLLLLLAGGARGLEVPLRGVALRRGGGNATLSLLDVDNLGLTYLARLELGTPAQPLYVLLDTGSSDVWVLGEAAGLDGLHVPFRPARSSTYRDSGASFRLKYLKGEVAGAMGVDTARLAGLEAPAQSFGLAARVNAALDVVDRVHGVALDGIAGLAFRGLAASGRPTLMDTLQAAGAVRRRLFAFRIVTPWGPAAAGSGANGSEPASVFAVDAHAEALRNESGPVSWLPVLSSMGRAHGTWGVRLQGVRVGGAALPVCADGPRRCTVIADTGTSLVGVPRSVWPRLVELVAANRPDCAVRNGSDLLVCADPSTRDMPAVSFSAGGRSFELLPAEYCNGRGLVGFEPVDSQTDDDMWIFGVVFLSRHLPFYDMDNRRAGLGTRGTDEAPFVADRRTTRSVLGLRTRRSAAHHYALVAALALAAALTLGVAVAEAVRGCRSRGAPPAANPPRGHRRRRSSASVVPAPQYRQLAE